MPGFRPFLGQLPGERSDEITIGLEGLELKPHDTALGQPGSVIFDRPFLRTIAHGSPQWYIWIYSRIFG
jgi:hypothetical protein